MASSTNDCPEPPDSLSVSVPIIACLTVHVSGHGVKKKSTKKEIKTKEFDHSFSVMKLNYLNFLAVFLEKHHVNKLQVTDCRCYTLKMQVPSSA